MKRNDYYCIIATIVHFPDTSKGHTVLLFTAMVDFNRRWRAKHVWSTLV